MTDLDRSPFDPGLDEMRQMGADVVDLVTRFIDDRYTAPAADYSDLEPSRSLETFARDICV